MGVEKINPDLILAVAHAASVEEETILIMRFVVSAESVYGAILAADAIG